MTREPLPLLLAPRCLARTRSKGCAEGHQDVRPGTPPLTSIRVIERTNLLSCRLAGLLLLADQGAPRSSWTAPRPTLAADQHAGLDNGYFDRGKIALPDGAAADAASVDIVIVDGTAEFARRIENAGALRVRSARTRAAHDVFDVAAADADIAQFMIRELLPSVRLVRNRLRRVSNCDVRGSPVLKCASVSDGLQAAPLRFSCRSAQTRP